MLGHRCGCQRRAESTRPDGRRWPLSDALVDEVRVAYPAPKSQVPRTRGVMRTRRRRDHHDLGTKVSRTRKRVGVGDGMAMCDGGIDVQSVGGAAAQRRNVPPNGCAPRGPCVPSLDAEKAAQFLQLIAGSLKPAFSPSNEHFRKSPRNNGARNQFIPRLYGFDPRALVPAPKVRESPSTCRVASWWTVSSMCDSDACNVSAVGSQDTRSGAMAGLNVTIRPPPRDWRVQKMYALSSESSSTSRISEPAHRVQGARNPCEDGENGPGSWELTHIRC